MAIKVNESSGQKKQSYYQRGESRYVYKINDQIKQIQDYVGPLFDSLERKESQNLQAMENIAHMTTQSINNLAAKADQMISEASDFAKEIQTTSNTILVITLIIAMVLSLVIGGLLTRNIIMPLRQAVNASKQLADGDLTVRIETKNTDETGQLLESMDHLSKTMHEVISEIASSSEQVATGAMQLAQTTENVNNLVDSQKSDTDQIAAAMAEMVATSNEMTRNTQNAFDAANEANKYATLGNQSVSETIQAINDIAGDVENVSSVINDVNTHSDKIGSVVDVIEGIAEQTNLLALNAAIEAARAGEQGRGFAVVADEVRNLATRTQESTLQIQQMIEQLQSGTKTAVSAMESNRSKAQDYAKKAEKGREALTEIINSVKTILDMNQQIATASEEQSAVCEDLDNNVVTISDSCSQTATHSTEISRQSDELSSMAEMLKTMVQRFTI
jgi:methyl-accepting chemotaxis protein